MAKSKSVSNAGVQRPHVAAIGLPRAITLALSRPGTHAVDAYVDSDEFLLSTAPFDYAGYVVRLEQQGVPGLNLIRLVRKRSPSPVIAVVDELDEGFAAALDAGAALVVPLDVKSDAWPAALRSAVNVQPAKTAGDWALDVAARSLLAPDGRAIPLGATDTNILALFERHPDHSVGHDELKAELWGSEAAQDLNALHATMYRLRKRIERGSQAIAPLQAVPKVGYVFRGRLIRRGASQG